MHDAIRIMLEHYDCSTREGAVNALREILQELALLGLWRAKFFEHAAFYGGTALRILYGLDRYSEDLDFTLLKPDPAFTIGAYGEALAREIRSFGFQVEFTQKTRSQHTSIDSAFLKADTRQQVITVLSGDDNSADLYRRGVLKIKLEVDVDPPGDFTTESRYLLQPIPFAVRTCSLPDLFAGKMHAVLCRRWKSRIKGRDWYDLVWYAGRYPHMRLSHLEARMRQSGDYTDPGPLRAAHLMDLLKAAIAELDVDRARTEVAPFVRDQGAVEVWSRDFFYDVIRRIEPV